MGGGQETTGFARPDAERVSVVLATYNGSAFLDEQLESLRLQSRLPDELVVVDDASTDDTLQLVRRFERRAPFPIVLIAQTEHRGTCPTFDEGLRAATGDILAICDQDDRWHPDKLAVMTEHMARRPEVLLAFTDAVLIDADGSRLSRSRWRVAGFGPDQWAAMERDPLGQMLMRQVVSGCTAAVRRDLLPALLPFPSDLHPALPTMMYDRWISLLAAATGRIQIIPERLVEYRIHPGQQIGIPALPLRRLFPQTALRLGQFVAPGIEKVGRFGYQQAHLTEISKRIALSNLESAAAEHVVSLAHQHLHVREQAAQRVLPALQVLKSYLDDDSYRRFSLGLAAAVSDIVR